MTRIAKSTVVMFVFLICVRFSLSQEAASPSADGALKLLKEGNDRFAQGKLAGKDSGMKKRELLAKGQTPFAIVLACADSRVAPELIFDQGLGDLFVLRVAGNIADSFILGSMEFAVDNLKTPLIVVIGHENCGAVAGAFSKGDFTGNLGKLIKEIHVGTDLPAERAAALPLAIKNNVVFTAEQLTQRSDILKNAVAQKKVKIVRGVYRLGSGVVEWID